MEILCRVTAAGFVPKYGSDWEKKRRMREGSDVVLTARKARSAGLHRKFFALVRLVADNLPEDKALSWHAWDEEGMLKKFKRDLGYYTVWYNERGEREIDYVSIAFEKMDQWEFERFYERCVDLALREYVPGLGREDLMDNIANFM